MTSPDAQRVWFPEMVEHLRAAWRGDLTFEAIVEVRDRLDAMLQQVRSEQGIRPAPVKCKKCGKWSSGPEPHVSVRSMILAVLRFEIGQAEDVHRLEVEWAMHRRLHGLGIYGKSGEVPSIACCAQP